jgi:hypothetical protein
MTRADWFDFIKYGSAAAVIFYLRLWHLESLRTGSWKKGHAALWKKPKKWQVITFCILWGFIILGFVTLVLTGRTK